MPSKPWSRKSNLQAELTGTVRRIVPHVEGVWAEISLDGADEFWRDIRVRNPIRNQDGSATLLRRGNRVIITIARAKSPNIHR